MLQAALQGIQSIGERSFGRGAVVGERSLGYPDAGAHALGIFLILVFFDIYC
ncbi:dihydroxyacetone kinase, ATP-dependent [Bacillus cereus]|nr:dihydroxyacetone kinase, ATP-dependent [Bacillus cereus]